MKNSTTPGWDGIERRQANSCRRTSDRRTFQERRYDSRNTKNPNRTFRGWLRSFTHTRLGVDRRKRGEQRIVANRRNPRPSSMLTKEEIADLLR